MSRVLIYTRETYLKCRFIDNYFVEAGLDQASAEMFKLLSGLHQKIPPSSRESDRNTLARVARPDIQARVSRATMYCQKVQVRVKAS